MTHPYPLSIPASPDGARTALQLMPGADIQRLWFGISTKEDWRSLAIIPATPGGAPEWIAEALVQAACCECMSRVLLVNMRLEDAHWSAGDVACRWPVLQQRGNYDTIDVSRLGPRRARELIRFAPRWLRSLDALGAHERQVFALDALLDNPAGLPIVRHLDRALLVVQLGRTSVEVAERTVELVGRDRFLGVLSV